MKIVRISDSGLKYESLGSNWSSSNGNAAKTQLSIKHIAINVFFKPSPPYKVLMRNKLIFLLIFFFFFVKENVLFL